MATSVPKLPGPQASRRKVASIVFIAAFAELILISVTWRLWFVQSEFPRVPLMTSLRGCPTDVVRGLSGAFALSVGYLGWVTIRTRLLPPRLLTAVVFFLGASTVCCNQHCLQPWHWLFLLILGVRLAVPDAEFLSAVQRIVPWIYVFAAVSRFGPEIGGGMSRQIVMALLDLVNLPFVVARPSAVTVLSISATLYEFLTGICLLMPRFRRSGVLLAVVMHALLIFALGPLGLQQEYGVLIWNGYLACLAVQLWWTPSSQPEHWSPATRAVVVFGFLWPALALFGVTDNWTGWQVYSPRPEVLKLQVHVDAVGQLPDSVKPHIDPPVALQDWSAIRLDRWCLQETGAPLYPQANFQRSVALEATTHVTDDDHIRGRMSKPQRLLWWNRQRDEYSGRKALSQANR